MSYWYPLSSLHRVILEHPDVGMLLFNLSHVPLLKPLEGITAAVRLESVSVSMRIDAIIGY